MEQIKEELNVGKKSLEELEKARDKELIEAGALRVPDERLSKEEAGIYQDYATTKENKYFSEQASEEGYKEAERLIQKLRDAGVSFEFLDLDWDKIDFRDTRNLADTEERLVAAVRQFLDQIEAGAGEDKETKTTIEQVKDYLSTNGKKAALYLLLSAGVLTANIGEGLAANVQSKVNMGVNEKIESKIEDLNILIQLPSQIEFDGSELSTGHLEYLTYKGFARSEKENNTELYREIILKWAQDIKTRHPAVKIKALNLNKIKHSIKSLGNDSDPSVGSGISIELYIEVEGKSLNKLESYGYSLYKMGRSAHDMTSVYLSACENADIQALDEVLRDMEGQIISLIKSIK